MRVLLLSRYTRLGPSSRVRSYQFLPALEAAGIEVEPTALFGDRYMRQLYGGRGPATLAEVVRAYASRLGRLLATGTYDLLWIEKELLPWVPGPAEQALIRGGTPYVLDFDDAIFHRYDQHRSPLVRWALGAKLTPLVRGAAAVVVGNAYLGDYFRAAGARAVLDLPSVVDVRRYSVRPPRRSSNPEVRIGWIGNPGTSHYLQLVRPALQSITRGGGVTFITIGAANNEALDGVAHRARPWSEDGEVSELQELDFGIMPLPDRPVERGKCGYKIVQYMACGLPTVASPVGANSVLVRHGQTGFLASGTTEWIQRMNQLAREPELRNHMGRAARTECEAHYSHQQVVPKLIDLFERVTRPHRTA